MLAYSQVGYYFVMRHFQNEQKEAVKEKIFRQIKDEELEIISVNNQKIYWEEEGKEFFLNGKMYDVVKTKTVNGMVMLYCINDKKEKAYIDNYNSITKNNSSSDKKGKNFFDNSLILFVDNSEKNIDINFEIAANKFFAFDSFLSENVSDKVSPPPKV